MYALEPEDREKIDGLVAQLRAREIDLREFSNGILGLATRESARAVLAYLPAWEAGQFEWWFTAVHGDRIPPRGQSVYIGSGWEPLARRKELERAFHRAILDRREPL